MRRSLLDKLCCPFDRHDLALTVYQEKDGQIREGLLQCPACNRYYPIVAGLPIMSPDEYREKALEAPLLDRWGLQLENPQPQQDFRLDAASRQKALTS